MKNIDTLDLTGCTVLMNYTNWKGKKATRRVRVKRFFFGVTEYHKEPQFFMHGLDLDRNVRRDFATKDIENLRVMEGWLSDGE